MSVQIKGSGTIGGIDEGLNVVGVTTLTGTGEYLLKLNKSDSSAVYAQFTNNTSGTSTTDGFRIGMDSNEDGLVWLREDGNVKFGSNNLERLRITSAGLVGIGTVSPAHALDIQGSSASFTKIALSNQTMNTSKYEIIFGDQGQVNHVVPANREFTIATNNTERLRIKSDGTVGINTTGNFGNIALSIYGDDVGEGTAKGQLILKDNAAYNASPTAGILFQGIHAAGSQAIFAGIRGFKENATNGNYAGALAFDVRAHGAVAYEALRITSGGDFGTNGVTPTAQSGKVFHLHAGNAQQRFHMTNNTTGSGATDGFEIIVEQSANVRIRNFEAGALMFDTGGSNNEVMRLTGDGLIQAKTLSGSYYPIASVKDGSTSARAATSAWEIKKTLGPRAKTGYYYLENPYDGSVNTWWCDMTTDGGGWILIAHTGEGQMSSLATGDGNHWFNRSNKGGFDSVGSGYYKGGGYWRATNGAWAANTCGQLMWDVRVHNQFGYQQYGYHDTAESASKVVFNWGTDQALPNGASSLSNIPNANNRRFNEWCYEVQNAPGFNPNNYHQNVRSNVINGANYFTEHMVMTWSLRGTGGAGDANADGPYWMIGSHHDGQHQHYEESLSGSDGVYGDGGYQVCSNQDTYWANNPSGTNQGMRRLAKFDDNGTVNVWLR